VYAVIKTIPTNESPYWIAVDQSDDTVYVTVNPGGISTTGWVDVINGTTGERDDSVSVSRVPQGVAVHQQDDTVYVAGGTPSLGRLFTIKGTGVTSQTTVENNPYGVAIDQTDDTVYVANRNSNTLSVVNGRTGSVVGAAIPIGDSPRGVAVHDADDTVYVANSGDDSISLIDGRTGLQYATIAVGDNPYGVAVDQLDDTVYVTNNGNGRLSVIDGRGQSVVRTLTGFSSPRGVAVDQTDDTVFVADDDGSGTLTVINGRNLNDSVDVGIGDDVDGVAVDDDSNLAYVASYNGDFVAVVAQVSPVLQTTSGAQGSTGSIALSVATLPASYSFDDTALRSVLFDGVAVTGLTRATANTWTFTVPAGAQGSTAAVTVRLNGMASAGRAPAGDFTYTGSPTPPEPPVTYPPSAPTGVTAVPGDGSAVVSWSAPDSAGSFPITDYEVAASPAGATCLVKAPALTCDVDGLSNGTPYTFSVRALNGAGWSPRSAMSAPVTPTPPLVRTIQITGSRGAEGKVAQVLVDGVTTGLAGATVQARVRLPGELGYANGSQRTVGGDGAFQWQRKTKKTVYVYFQTLDGDVRSNRVIIALG
jgi:YVTN family beta-propeller protein